MIRRGTRVEWRPKGSPLTMSGRFDRRTFDIFTWKYVYLVVTDDGKEHSVEVSTIVKEGK